MTIKDLIDKLEDYGDHIEVCIMLGDHACEIDVVDNIFKEGRVELEVLIVD